MAPRDGEEQLIEQLVHDLLKKTDALYSILNSKMDTVNDRMDSKVDILSDKMSEEFKLLRKELSDQIGNINTKLEKAEDKIINHEVRITRIEQTWVVLAVIITAVAGCLASLINWLGHFIVPK